LSAIAERSEAWRPSLLGVLRSGPFDNPNFPTLCWHFLGNGRR
jgi:hypothetical protein